MKEWQGPSSEQMWQHAHKPMHTKSPQSMYVINCFNERYIKMNEQMNEQVDEQKQVCEWMDWWTNKLVKENSPIHEIDRYINKDNLRCFPLNVNYRFEGQLHEVLSVHRD